MTRADGSTDCFALKSGQIVGWVRRTSNASAGIPDTTKKRVGGRRVGKDPRRSQRSEDNSALRSGCHFLRQANKEGERNDRLFTRGEEELSILYFKHV